MSPKKLPGLRSRNRNANTEVRSGRKRHSPREGDRSKIPSNTIPSWDSYKTKFQVYRELNLWSATLHHFQPVVDRKWNGVDEKGGGGEKRLKIGKAGDL